MGLRPLASLGLGTIIMFEIMMGSARLHPSYMPRFVGWVEPWRNPSTLCEVFGSYIAGGNHSGCPVLIIVKINPWNSSSIRRG